MDRALALLAMYSRLPQRLLPLILVIRQATSSAPILRAMEPRETLLQELARAQAIESPRLQEARAHHRPYEGTPALQKVPPSEWRSLGGFFDYCHWADRDRFLELDKAIAASRGGQTFEFENDTEMC